MARILIAEDDPITQKLLFRIIEKMGHTPFISPNGKHAWEALQSNNHFDMLISDLMMPEMDGRELIRLMRNTTKYMKFPIILISAVIKISEISDLLDMGASSFLGKPIDRNDLQDNIDQLLPEGVTSG